MKRGYIPQDDKEFSQTAFYTLKKAGEELFYLLNRGYPIKPASTFIANHYMLSQRQRIAIVRGVSSENSIYERKKKELKGDLLDRIVYIDGFNLIITLEVAFSNSTLIRCMDGNIRDLAGLRGTYRIIDKTDMAINAVCKALNELKIKKVIVYLDSPVSNSGRLKTKLSENFLNCSFDFEINLVDNADVILEKLDNVITSDAIILDKCKSWFNLCDFIIDKNILIDFTEILK